MTTSNAATFSVSLATKSSTDGATIFNALMVWNITRVDPVFQLASRVSRTYLCHGGVTGFFPCSISPETKSRLVLLFDDNFEIIDGAPEPPGNLPQGMTLAQQAAKFIVK